MITVQHRAIDRNTPAKIFPGLRLIVIDPEKFYAIPSFNMRVFVLAHELAHLVHTNEIEADWKAFEMYCNRGYPVRDAIFAITRLLPASTAHQRIVPMLRRYHDNN